jgi:hypothetical protein
VEPKVKRYVIVKLLEVPKSDLYPDGQLFEVSFVRLKRSGEEDRIYLGTEYLTYALDEAEAFMETGVVGGQNPKA